VFTSPGYYVPLKNIRLTIIAISAVMMVFGVCLYGIYVPVGDASAEPVTVSIRPGYGVSRIASSLKDAGLIRSTWLFVAYVLAAGQEKDLQAGTYVLSPNSSLAALAETIAQGKAEPTDITVTIKEGMNVWEIDDALAEAKLIGRQGAFATKYRSSEGMLFPETYRFAPDASITDIGTRLLKTFLERSGRPSPEQVIKASILEKEAKTKEDMRMVAGIIERRLREGIALQIDASVAYGWCLRTIVKGSDCDVTQAPIASEIKVDGPYNTYTRRGLPEGPISNPGRIALWAAANPLPSDFLYYLSTRDGSQIIYSKTLQEHLLNRRKYLGF